MRQQLILDPLPHQITVGRRVYGVLRACSPNGRVHWSVKRAAQGCLEWYAAVALQVANPPLVPVPPPATIQMLWTFPTKRARDADNIVATGKCLQDFLVRRGILVGDHAEVLHLQPPIIQVERGVRRLVICLESEE